MSTRGSARKKIMMAKRQRIHRSQSARRYLHGRAAADLSLLRFQKYTGSSTAQAPKRRVVDLSDPSVVRALREDAEETVKAEAAAELARERRQQV